MNHRERAEKFVTSEPWCSNECPECGVRHTNIPKLQKMEVALATLFTAVSNEALEEVLIITDEMEGTEWDACGDWLGRKVRALKERP